MTKKLFRLKRTRETVDADLDAELRYHFERGFDELMKQGFSSDEARREMRRRFGDVSRHRRNLEAIGRRRAAMEWRTEWLDIVRQNLGYAWRAVRRSPGFSCAVVITLGLGIGANATMFGVVDRLLLRPPLHITNPEQVRRLFVNRTLLGRPVTTQGVTYPDYRDFDTAEHFAATAAYSGIFPQTMGRGETAVRVASRSVSASFFGLLGVAPALGRFFTADEDRIGQPGRVVLGYALWQRQFGGAPAPDALGRVLHIGDVDYTVVGVAPRGFTGTELEPVDAWLSLHAVAEERRLRSRGWYWLRVVARLRPGATVEAAEAEATTLHRNGRAESQRYDQEATISAAPLIAARGPNASDETAVTKWLAGVALIVLLIACANVANLFLAKGVRSRREIAVRLALGVSRSRLVGQLLTESAVFAILGGGTALLIAHWGGNLLRNVLVPGVAWPESPVHPRVLLFTLVATAFTVVIAGLVPALQSRRPNLTGALKAGEAGGAARHSLTRIGFLIVQGALSVVLLIGAGLFVRSLSRIHAIDLGIDADRILTVTLDRETAGPPTERRIRTNQLFVRAEERLRDLPGVGSVSSANSLQFWTSWGTALAVPGRDSLPTVPTGGPYYNAVTADYFATMGMTILRGRGFTDADHRENAPRVVVVDETMARLYWPDEDARGQCLLIGSGDPPCSEVVGIVRDSRRQELIEDVTLQYFIPVESHTNRGVVAELETLLARTTEDPYTLVEAVRREVQALDPSIKFVNARPMQELIDPQRRSWRLGAAMFAVFGGLALVVAAIGLYSMLAFSVAQRTRELGVRAALGATSTRLIALVFGEGMRFTAIGMGLGTAIALLAGRAVEPLLFDVSPRDPAVFTLVMVTLGLVAALASAFPAWRATRIDPNRALRTE